MSQQLTNSKPGHHGAHLEASSIEATGQYHITVLRVLTNEELLVWCVLIQTPHHQGHILGVQASHPRSHHGLGLVQYERVCVIGLVTGHCLPHMRHHTDQLLLALLDQPAKSELFIVHEVSLAMEADLYSPLFILWGIRTGANNEPVVSTLTVQSGETLNENALVDQPD